MKTIELSVIGREDDRSVCYYHNGELVGWLSDNCGITNSDIILIGKKDFEELLANQKKPERKDLPLDTKVMYETEKGSEWWGLGLYKGNKTVAPVREDISPSGAASLFSFSSRHIIPYSLFDPENPDKWNGTENDYGTGGGAR